MMRMIHEQRANGRAHSSSVPTRGYSAEDDSRFLAAAGVDGEF